MFTFLLIVHAIIAAALVAVILMQRSEGGGLGMGSGPSGLMTARGAADFLTRATGILAALFVAMAFVLAAYASMRNRAGAIDTSLAGQSTVAPIAAPKAATPASGIPMMGAPTLPGDPTAAQPITAPGAAAPAATKVPAPVQTRPAPTAASLKTIDTKALNSATGGSVGINGVSGGSSRHSNPMIPAPAPASASSPKTGSVPTVDLPAPAAASTGNSAQPQ